MTEQFLSNANNKMAKLLPTHCVSLVGCGQFRSLPTSDIKNEDSKPIVLVTTEFI